MGRRSIERALRAASALSLVCAAISCTTTREGNEGPAVTPPEVEPPTDPAATDPEPEVEPPAKVPPVEAPRPGKVASLEGAEVLVARAAPAPAADEAPRRPTVATPPLPSEASGGYRGEGGFGPGGGYAAADGRARRSAAVAAEAEAAPVAETAAAYPAPPGGAPSAPAPSLAIGGSGADLPASPPMIASAAMARPLRVLTAAAVSDADHPEDFLGFVERQSAIFQSLGLDMSRRVRLLVVDAEDRPVGDARVTVVGAGASAVGRTHADGIWDLYPSFSAPALRGPVTVHVQAGGLTVAAAATVPARGDGGTLVVRLPGVAAERPRRLDLAFLIDVTGSMGDELAYVTAEVTGIVDRVRTAVPGVEVRVAATFYRDRGDSIPIEQIPFSSELSDFVARMRYVSASGGGDYPEDMESGLAAAMSTLAWSEEGAARALVVIADAPPQRYGDSQYGYRQAMEDATRRGVRLLPVAASGADRTVEVLFRAMGALTSTPYVHLTDDSGIGGSHLEADTDTASREMFSDLLTRLLIAELEGEGMHA